MDGAKAEREFVNAADTTGWYVMRAPASGSGTDRELPDVLLSKVDEPVYAGEVKAAKGAIRESSDKINDLLTFCRFFGAEPRLIARLHGDTTLYVCDPREHLTDAGNVHMTHPTVRDVCMPFVGSL